MAHAARARWTKIMTKIRNSPLNPLVELVEEKIENLKSKVWCGCCMILFLGLVLFRILTFY